MNILRTSYTAMKIIAIIAIDDETYHIQFLDDILQRLPWFLCHYLRKGHPINDVMISYGERVR